MVKPCGLWRGLDHSIPGIEEKKGVRTIFALLSLPSSRYDQ